MARVCVRHPFEHSESICGSCGLEYCRDCLVYPHGQRKAPFCVPCALAAGGVRAGAQAKSGLSRREVKHRARERRREEKALNKMQRVAGDIPMIENPFTPGWALIPDDEPDLRELFPPLDFDADVRAAEARPEPEPIPPVADAEQEAPEIEDPMPAETPGPVISLADLAPSRPEDGEDEELDEDEELAARARGLPLPTLRRRNDTAEPAEVMSWLDQVFSAGRSESDR